MIPSGTTDPERTRRLLNRQAAMSALLMAAVVGFYAIASGVTASASAGLRAAAILAAIAAGSCGVGGLLGFVFGVPKREARSVQGDAARNLLNSNLAEVSDWLTKILLGAGLVQLAAVPGAFAAFGDWVDGQISAPGAQQVAVGLVVFGLTSWFIWAWLFTSLWLLPALDAEDQEAQALKLAAEEHAATRQPPPEKEDTA